MILKSVISTCRAVRTSLLGISVAAVTAAGLSLVDAHAQVSAAPAAPANCGARNNCTPKTFADAIFRYPGIGAPVTGANESAMQTWERAEGGNWHNTAHCNPLNTTQREPGSSSINSVGVQAYRTNSGHTCWFWGIRATGQTLENGFYGPILSAMRHPASSSHAQCVNLARAVGRTPWGTGNFSADC
jgi:hypothetical protein